MMGTKFFVLRFGDFEVREREFSLVKAGAVLPVEPKAFRALLFLLHNPQKLIPKEELVKAVWGDTAVADGSLTRCIWLLRRLLEDDFNEPRYIETVATVGYRLVCPVEASEDAHGGLSSSNSANNGNGSEPASNSKEAVGVTTTRGRSERRALAGLISVGVIALLATAFWYLHRPLPPLRVAEYTPIIHGSNMKFLVGTDGARLYFLDGTRLADAEYSPKSQPTLQAALSGGAFEQVSTSLPGAILHDVSPDGSSLLITSFDGSLWSFQVPGGAIRNLTHDSVLSASWSVDGKLAIYSTADKRDIKLARSDGTGAQMLVPAKALGEPTDIEGFAWSPDGKTIRLIKNNKLWEMSSDGSGIHPLLSNWHAPSDVCCGHWSPDGRFFVFQVSDHIPGTTFNFVSPSQLWVLDERRGVFRQTPTEPTQLTSGPIRWVSPIFSKDGKKVFARGVIQRGELVRFDAQSHQFLPFLGGISAEYVSFSADGKFMAYVTYPEGILWSANLDGSSPVQLTNPPLYPINPRWSPDGNQILYGVTDANGNGKAYLVPSRGGTPQLLVPDDKGQQADPNWSPDGRKVVFTSGGPYDPKGELRILDLASHQFTVVPGSAGVWSPRWSPDGRFIAGLEAGNWDLKVFDFETRQWSLRQKGQAGWLAFSRNSQFIYFTGGGADQAVLRVRASGGNAERVVDLKGFRYAGSNVGWMGLDPTDAPMRLRDIGSDDIYALTLEEK